MPLDQLDWTAGPSDVADPVCARAAEARRGDRAAPDRPWLPGRLDAPVGHHTRLPDANLDRLIDEAYGAAALAHRISDCAPELTVDCDLHGQMTTTAPSEVA